MSDKEWWHTDVRGRKIGWLWPEDLLAIIDSIWGKRKGIGGFARYAGLHRNTVERWCRGENPVPREIALLIELMQREVISRVSGHNRNPHQHLPSADAPWLKESQDKGLARMPYG